MDHYNKEPAFFESPSGGLLMLHNPTPGKLEFMNHMGCLKISPELYKQKKQERIGTDEAPTGGYEELEVE